MKAWLDRIMAKRAAALTQRLSRYLAGGGMVADVGSGTGHNAQAWRSSLGVCVDEFDVADLHWVGFGPTLFDGKTLPSGNGTYSRATLLFVLQYTSNPVELLAELRRICTGSVLVIQSTYRSRWGHLCLSIRELIWGRAAFCVARVSGVLGATSCPLRTRQFFTRKELRRAFEQAGLIVLTWEPSEWWGMHISRDLYVLEASSDLATCR